MKASEMAYLIEHLTARAEAAEADARRYREWIKTQGEAADICTFNVLQEVCNGCRCHRNRPAKEAK